MLVRGLDEILYIDEVAHSLSTRIHQGRVYPDGFKYVHRFSHTPFPSWIFHVEDLVFEKNLLILRDEQTVIVRYRILEGNEDLVRLEVRPIAALRQVNELLREHPNWSTTLERVNGRIRYSGLYFYHNAAVLDQSGLWIRGVEYLEDKKQKRDYEEDLYTPFRLLYAFNAKRDNYLCISLIGREKVRFQEYFDRETDLQS